MNWSKIFAASFNTKQIFWCNHQSSKSYLYIRHLFRSRCNCSNKSGTRAMNEMRRAQNLAKHFLRQFAERKRQKGESALHIHIVGRRRRRNDDGQAECVNNVHTRTNSLASLFLGCSTFHRMMKRNLIESAFRRPKKSPNRFVLHSHTALFTHTRALWSAI